jgi:PAS domain S-box-containing protein
MLDFFEFSNEMLAVTDSRGYAIRVNSAWTKTLGWSVEELLGRPYTEFIHPDDAPAANREVELLLSGQPSIRDANKRRCPDDESGQQKQAEQVSQAELKPAGHGG